MWMCNYLGITFMLLTMDNVFSFYRNIWYIGSIVIALIYVYFTNFAVRKVHKEHPNVVEKELEIKKEK